MISCIYQGFFDTHIKKTKITEKKWYGDIHSIIIRFFKKKSYNFHGAYDISVVLVGEKKMRELYAAYKGRNRVTDVLSFLYEKEKEDPFAPSGEIFICIPQAVRQAKRYHISLAHEMARLAIHGFLHIYGYDHKEKQERAIMRSCERAILQLCKKENLY